jgi:hypothetical protein
VREAWGEVCSKGNGATCQSTTGSEYAVKLEVLNAYVLGAIGLFAICLYIAVIVSGFADLRSRLSKVGIRKKLLKNRKAVHRWRNSKRSPHS